jgi:hypothetical protein
VPFTFSKNKPPSRLSDNIINTEKELGIVKTLQQKYLSGRFSSIIGFEGKNGDGNREEQEKVSIEPETAGTTTSKPHYRSDNKFEYTFSNKAEPRLSIGGDLDHHGSKATVGADHPKSTDQLKPTDYRFNKHKDLYTEPKPVEYKTEYTGYNTTEGKFDIIATNVYSPVNSNSLKSENENRNDIKEFLMTVKGRVDSYSFKEFIKYIKILTSKETNIDRNEIFIKVKELFGNSKDLYDKFEKIIVFKK